jgi:hypothetical protein
MKKQVENELIRTAMPPNWITGSLENVLTHAGKELGLP